MTKRLMLGAALSALMVSGALAQTSTPPSANQTKPPAAAPADPGTNAAIQAASAPQVVAAQQPDQWLASNFKGTDVIGTNGKKIGDVSDILFDQSGRIEAYVVSFGGFLGVGAKDVAIAPNSFQVVPGEKGEPKKLKLAMDENQLKQAQKFTQYQPPKPATTTGAGGAMGGGTIGSGAMGSGTPASGPKH